VARSKVISRSDALELVPDGARIAVGGTLLRRKPVAFLTALALAGRRDLRLYSFLASLDVELLVALGAASAVHSGYVGFEQLGFAPAFRAAADAGTIEAYEYSELLFTTGLRASVAGLPFLPTRGAAGSDLIAELGLRTVTCPYTGEDLTAVPALRPDVCVLHAEAADANGTIAAPSTRDFLFDADALLARASERVIVTVERIATEQEVRDAGALVYGFEVEAVVVEPRGAHPGAIPGVHGPNLPALRTYLAAAPTDARAAALALIEETR
jgi:glutaconate CoA-transferase subunit A